MPKICEFAVRIAKEAGLSEAAAYQIELAVDEACTNIVEHAYGGKEKGDIECTCQVTDKGLKIVLRDTGIPFDPTAVPEPDLSTPLEDLDPGGAGLFLMRKMMDEVHFKFDKKSGNTLTMVKYRR